MKSLKKQHSFEIFGSYNLEETKRADISDLKGKKIGIPGIMDSSVIALKRKLHDIGIGVTTTNMEVELITYNLTAPLLLCLQDLQRWRL